MLILKFRVKYVKGSNHHFLYIALWCFVSYMAIIPFYVVNIRYKYNIKLNLIFILFCLAVQGYVWHKELPTNYHTTHKRKQTMYKIQQNNCIFIRYKVGKSVNKHKICNLKIPMIFGPTNFFLFDTPFLVVSTNHI